MNVTIAGHTFHDTPHGRACRYCTMRWVNIAHATETDIGRDGFAHVGHLTEAEFYQIKAERDRIWDAVIKGAGI